MAHATFRDPRNAVIEPRNPLVRRIVGVLTRIELAFGALMLLMILVLVFLQAAQRYMPGEGFAWTGELSRFGMAWLTFSVAGVLITLRGHITLEVVDTLPKPQLVRTVQVFSLLVVAVVAAGLTVEAWNLVSTEGRLSSPVLGMPMSIVYVPILAGMCSTVLRSLLAAWTVAFHGALEMPGTAEKEEIA